MKILEGTGLQRGGDTLKAYRAEQMGDIHPESSVRSRKSGALSPSNNVRMAVDTMILGPPDERALGQNMARVVYSPCAGILEARSSMSTSLSRAEL